MVASPREGKTDLQGSEWHRTCWSSKIGKISYSGSVWTNQLRGELDLKETGTESRPRKMQLLGLLG